ncbi:ligase-associated DNA damage response endonuclease PdeM [Thioclava litoralis]|uniref:Ligase-associated DNA damage response endonuclease PdeM n=1 Tax=Thioclava litoralis TaxID=3076557 RepID=A0ABZ1E2N6_9RHOB|nr:ligase-associated DNA damage response endonuclease PdeM [Thioclava sp. FTW29]
MSSILPDFDEKLVTAPVRFAGHSFMVLSTGALYWPERRTLILGDLHFGKAERVARRGGALLPPFGDLDTLARLDATLFFTKPACVVSLGDAFDDDEAGRSLARSVKARLAAIAKVSDWIWITGNHDPGQHDLPGDIMPELRFGNLTFRHKAGRGPDISGHFHPKTRIAGRAARALLVGETHMVLPAFGTFTGGLEMDHPELARLTGGGIAYAMGRKILRVPIPALPADTEPADEVPAAAAADTTAHLPDPDPAPDAERTEGQP